MLKQVWFEIPTREENNHDYRTLRGDIDIGYTVASRRDGQVTHFTAIIIFIIIIIIIIRYIVFDLNRVCYILADREVGTTYDILAFHLSRPIHP